MALAFEKLTEQKIFLNFSNGKIILDLRNI